MSRKQPFLSALLILLFITNMAAQQTALPVEPETPQQKEARKAVEQKALALLDDIIKEAQSLKLPENRGLLLTTAADLYWPHDQTRARSLIKEAIKNLEELVSVPDSVEDASDYMRSYRAASAYTQMRLSILQTLAQRDPRWARELLRTTSQTKLVTNAESGPFAERNIELNIASVVAGTDPKQALEMAEASLKQGVSYQLVDIVARLEEKDREAATSLAANIVAKLKTEKPTATGETFNVALKLFQTATEPRTTSSGKPEDKSSQSVLSEQSLRDLAEMLIVAALSSETLPYSFISQIQVVMPALEKYAPARVAQLRRKTADVKTSRTGQEVQRFEDMMARKNKKEELTPEALIEAAAKVPSGEMRNQYYYQAATKMLEKGEEEKARQLINERVQDPQQRAMMLAQLNQEAMRIAAEKGRIEETRRLLSRSRSDEERIGILLELARAVGAKGEKDAAIKLLAEARSMLSNRVKTARQMWLQLQVARGYARVEPARTLEILDSMIVQLNELLDAAILLGGFIAEEEFVKDDEVQMSLLNLLIGGSREQFGMELNALARADFDGLKALADKFQRSEVRILARLLVAQSALSDMSAPPRSVRPNRSAYDDDTP